MLKQNSSAAEFPSLNIFRGLLRVGRQINWLQRILAVGGSYYGWKGAIIRGGYSALVILAIVFITLYMIDQYWKAHLFLALLLIFWTVVIEELLRQAFLRRWHRLAPHRRHPPFFLFFLTSGIFAGIGGVSFWWIMNQLPFANPFRNVSLFFIFIAVMTCAIIFDTTQTILISLYKTIRLGSLSLTSLYLNAINSLSTALELKDSYTIGHSERVSYYAEDIAREMNLSKSEIKKIKDAAKFHDVGKIGIPENILNKPSRELNVDELYYIRAHPEMSVKILKPLAYLKDILPYVLHHHERHDGKGYPQGIEGENIPLGAKIIFVADAYDAMTTDRAYRKAISHEDAREEIIRNKGSQFDPQIVEIFLRVCDRWARKNQEI